jgi:branched-chain amino acid transport system permease protein
MDLPHILIMLAIYVLLVGALNIVLGYGGMISLCQAVFYGIGAYTTAILTTWLGWPPLLAMLFSGVVVLLFAGVLGTVSMHFRGDRFVLLTISLQVIVSAVMLNWTDMTGGTNGIPGIPVPNLFGWALSTKWEQAGFAITIAILGVLLLLRIHHSPYQRALSALRDDQLAAQSLGKPPNYFRYSALLTSGLLSATAGSLYALTMTFIDPTSFTIDESVFILTALAIGGSGNVKGPVVGAAVAVLLPEALRLLEIGGGSAANVRQILYGFTLILMMRFRPKGMAGNYDFS